MMRSGLRAWWIGVAIAALAVACGGDDDAPTSRIFSAPAWTGAETAEYNLVDREIRGYCTLITDPEFEPGKTRLVQKCRDAEGIGHTDEREAIVESSTLVPIYSERVLTNVEERDRTTYTGSYGKREVVFTYRRANLDDPSTIEEEFQTPRALPEPDEESPEPGWYDDESLFWLIRGLPLKEGFEGAYHNGNVGTAQLVVARVSVEGRERVTVPAGTFETWRVSIQTASITQRIWVEVAAPHRMIKARIERDTYELTSFE